MGTAGRRQKPGWERSRNAAASASSSPRGPVHAERVGSPRFDETKDTSIARQQFLTARRRSSRSSDLPIAVADSSRTEEQLRGLNSCRQERIEKPRQGKPGGAVSKPAMTYFRTFGHYHRPQLLNGRVRNGNACFQLGMVTGTPAPTAEPDGTGSLQRTSLRRGVWQRGIDREQRETSRPTARRMRGTASVTKLKWSSVCPLVRIR